MSTRPFGVSTHLFHHERLTRDHFSAIAAHGFEMVEVFATRTHFDYHNPAAVADLQQWLAEAGVTLRSVHAPTAASFVGGVWGGSMSIASVEPELRERAVRDTLQALYVARRIPIAVFVLHLGIPRMQPRDGDVGSQDVRGAAKKSVEELVKAAGPLGARLSARAVPVTITEVSCDKWSAALKTSSPTAAFDITPWMNPVPSRRIRKWILPLERRLCSHPLMVTSSPSCFPMSSM